MKKVVGNRILIVIIDYDNDIGKVGVKTPVVGFERVIRIAEEFGLRKPQDSDLNALFAGLKIYRDLIDKGYEPEIVVVSGSEKGGLEAFQNVKLQMRKVLEEGVYDSAIIVSDGGEDEKVYPLIQSMIPVEYIERVVVEQVRSVEATYILLWRYFRKVLEEPRLAKILIGYPGVILLAFSILALYNLLIQGVLVSLLILALMMIYRGFNIEELVLSSWKKNPARVISSISSAVVILIAVGLTYIIASSKIYEGASIYSLIGVILNTLVWIYALGISLPLIGEGLNRVFKRSFSAWKYFMALTAVAYISLLLRDLGIILSGTPPTEPTDILVRRIIESGFLGEALIALVVLVIASSILQMINRLYFRKKREKL
ncbi:MAG: DUF373 family protein [Sulfolobales archaeon]